MEEIVYVTSQNVHKTYWHQTVLENVLCETYIRSCAHYEHRIKLEKLEIHSKMLHRQLTPQDIAVYNSKIVYRCWV